MRALLKLLRRAVLSLRYVAPPEPPRPALTDEQIRERRRSDDSATFSCMVGGL